MTTYNRGDVILVPFPFTDLTTRKQRPAVIVSSNHYNQSGQDVINDGKLINGQPQAIPQATRYELPTNHNEPHTNSFVLGERQWRT